MNIVNILFCCLIASVSASIVDGDAVAGEHGLRETLTALSTLRTAPQSVGPNQKAQMSEYRPNTCAYCQSDTWCETRSNGKPQCRGCKIERFFEEVLYPPLGHKLQGWTRKVLRDLYGTVRPATGLRQYRDGYVSTGKQNGKSYLIGGLPIYHLVMEDELEPEAYGVASARDQAGIVFKAAAQLVRANPDLQSLLKVLDSVKRIVRRDGGGIYTVLSADGGVQDGKRPSLLLIDELHRFTRKKAETVLTVLKKGMISRAPVIDGVETGEPLMIKTTTSGDEFECPLWFSEYQYAQHVRDGSIEDDKYYSAIYQADPLRIDNEPDYWQSREARVSANPSHQDRGGFLADSELEKDMKEAIMRPEKYSDYIRLNLNVPCVSTGTPVIDMAIWQTGGGPDDIRKLEKYDVEFLIEKWNLKKRPCYAGVDLAWTTDMTGMTLLFPPEAESEKWKMLFFAWLPQGRIAHIEKITRAPLTSWVRRGFVDTVPGVSMIQTHVPGVKNGLLIVEDKLRWVANTFDLREMCFDSWGGMIRSAAVLAEEGMTCVDIDQKSFSILSPATKEFLALYLAGDLQHANHPVMNWHMSCLSLETDKADNVKPQKPKKDSSQKRIDLVASTVNAMVRALVGEENTIKYTGLRSVG